MALVVFCLPSKPCFKNLPQHCNTLKYIAKNPQGLEVALVDFRPDWCHCLLEYILEFQIFSKFSLLHCKKHVSTITYIQQVLDYRDLNYRKPQNTRINKRGGFSIRLKCSLVKKSTLLFFLSRSQPNQGRPSRGRPR